jgi:Raf kinase inhibitor-like YbhB/YbcL family protein
MTFTVSSNSFKDGDYLPSDFILSADFGFGCAGGNKSPHLTWSGVPEGTKSFAITCYDPDAPTGSGFWHWLVVNIPASVSELAEGAGSAGGKLPPGALQTRTDFGTPGYGGPCPPPGDHPHRYLFTGFAVKADKLEARHLGGGRRLQFAFQHLGQGANHGPVQKVEPAQKNSAREWRAPF